ncbi:mitochondrial import inner membrane translocase subunit Tim54, partial [Coniella lustricola]
PPPQNPALRMMGLPNLPRKLPSRNWLIFWTVAGTLTAAIVYDRREKRRATARWAHAVSHLAKEPLPHGNPSALPRKLTIYLEAPPGDGLRTAQDHYKEYVKPVLAASGLDWEFRQGRQQGDLRAVVAEEVRKRRRRVEADFAGTDLPTDEDVVDEFRRKHGIPEPEGVKGDLIIGRHAWKEYVRGLHEGWLGPLTAPPHAQPDPIPAKKDGDEDEEQEQQNAAKRPPQPKPYNSVDDYATAHLPMLMPAELTPVVAVPFPHILGFLNTPTRFYRFMTRRYLADEIGAEVAAACFAAYRDFRTVDGADADADHQWEQQTVLEHEEKNWLKSVWKEDDDDDKKKKTEKKLQEASEEHQQQPAPAPLPVAKKEKIWPRPMVLDARLAMRMKRFELQPEDVQRAAAVVVPEEEIEGTIKGSLRSLWNWATTAKRGPKVPNVGEVE